MLRVLSLFSGIGAFESALTRGGYDFRVVNYCEIDPYASKAYSQIHGISEDYNLHDVREVNPLLLDNINLVTYGFPCQDISVAGKQKGFEYNGERTRSGLFFEALRIIEFLQPEYAICENVKALTGKKFTAEFETVLTSLDKAGYNNYWKVLNAKDFGVPQNRERVFIVSIRKDIDDHNFFFPQPMPLLIRLKDVLEQKVDEKFYLKNERADKLIESLVQTYSPNISGENKIMALGHLGVGGQKGWVFDVNGISRCLAATDYKDPTKIIETRTMIEITEPKVKQVGNIVTTGNFKNPQRGRIYDADGISPTLNTMQGGGLEPKFIVPVICRSIGRNPENPSDRTAGAPTEQRLEPNSQGISNTLTTVQKDNYVLEQYRIRKLTPRECFRLMGFTDADFDKIKGISNTQLYKMVGNSIVVNVLEGIFRELFKAQSR